MSNLYRKKPVLVEAYPCTRESMATPELLPKWLYDALFVNCQDDCLGKTMFYSDFTGTFVIDTIEGRHDVSWGDYIIKGVKGELYPCKPDIFELTYDKVEANVD